MKVALIGSHPASILLAPYADPSWSIWVCSPGAAFSVPRADAFFEIHHFDRTNPSDPVCPREYLEKINALGCDVWMIQPIPEVPRSIAYPKAEMLERFGPYFFTSSLSWMIAKAIAEGAEEIGLWGVDMSAQEEYAHQRPACHHFITEARRLGIKITVPPQSDLLQPPPLYGYSMQSRMAQKGAARKVELARRVAEAEATFESKKADHFWHRGELESLVFLMPKLQPECVAEAEARKADLEKKVAETQTAFEQAKAQWTFLKGVIETTEYYQSTWLAEYPAEFFEPAANLEQAVRLAA